MTGIERVQAPEPSETRGVEGRMHANPESSRIIKQSSKTRKKSAICCLIPQLLGGRGILVVKVSDWGSHVTNLNPVPLKTPRVGQRCTLNLSRAETSSRWCGVIVRRGGCQLRCPCHLTMVQYYEVLLQKPSCS
ncbi:uncharacterized protein TNCV_4743771 [Trichonephila clavipes]|nr:uncharacterized protein TNCV_4743771 [Trichonephila clavipes]